jgi:hypothetical protein
MKKVTKKSSLKIKSLKTTSKFHSAPQAVRPADSTRGVLPLHFFVVFYAFYLRACLKVEILILLCFVLTAQNSFQCAVGSGITPVDNAKIFTII